MSSHPFDILPLDNGAQLIFTPCPGTKQASIEQSISTLKAAGTSTLITLMFDSEMATNNAQQLPQVCAAHGIEWLQLPISDDAAPNDAFETPWLANKARLVEILANKGTIAVHCKGGSGRTGLVIGLLLLAAGWPSERIIEQVQKLRPKALKHPVQLDYFNSHR